MEAADWLAVSVLSVHDVIWMRCPTLNSPDDVVTSASDDVCKARISIDMMVCWVMVGSNLKE